jgi:pimeloyl-ACP methyl ester carboxylesterase
MRVIHVPPRRGALGLLLVPLLFGSLSACKKEQDATAGAELETCRLEGVSFALSCTEIEVFENRETREGRKIKLKVAVAPALAPQPAADPIFILAGGPGQAATDVAGMLMPAFERLRRNRDLVFVDQRGTGASHPLHCLEDQPLDIQTQVELEVDPEAFRECLEGYDADVRQYGTTIAMADLDEVREKLGYEQVNLLGFSYGTRAALEYLRRYPERVRTATLDGVAPMQLYLPLTMGVDAEPVLEDLFKRCREDEGCNAAFPDLEARVRAGLERLETERPTVKVTHPVNGTVADVQVGRDHVMGTIRSVLYSADFSMLVPILLTRAIEEHDFNPLFAFAGGGGPQAMALGMHMSVVCTEDWPFFTTEQLAETNAETLVGSRLLSRMYQVCETWPKGEIPADFREPVRSDRPVLLLSGALDPVTPPKWGEVAKETLSNAHHEVVPGVGHNAIIQLCARRMVEAFIDGADPKAIGSDCSGAKGPNNFVLDFSGPRP